MWLKTASYWSELITLKCQTLLYVYQKGWWGDFSGVRGISDRRTHTHTHTLISPYRKQSLWEEQRWRYQSHLCSSLSIFNVCEWVKTEGLFSVACLLRVSARISQSMCAVRLQGLLSQEPRSGKWAGMDPFVLQMDTMVTATHKGVLFVPSSQTFTWHCLSRHHCKVNTDAHIPRLCTPSAAVSILSPCF